jgi:hypothetical protein
LPLVQRHPSQEPAPRSEGAPWHYTQTMCGNPASCVTQGHGQHQCARAVVTKCQGLASDQQWAHILSKTGAWRSAVKVLAGPRSSGDAWRTCSSSERPQLRSTKPSLALLLPGVGLYPSPRFMWTPVLLSVTALLTFYDLISCAKTPFPNRVTFSVPRGQNSR